MKNTKKWLALGVSIALLLSACGSKAPSSTPEAPGAVSSGTGTPEKKELDYPKKIITNIVSYAAGGGSDILARTIAANMNLDGQNMVVKNIEGGSGTIGLMECYNSDPDGYTICIGFPESISVQILTGSLDKEVINQFSYIGSPVYDINTLSVLNSSKFKSLEEVIAYAKEHPGELTIASVGSGINKFCVYEFMNKAGIELKYIPYDNSTKSKTAALGGQFDLWWSQASESKLVSDSGEMRVLAVAYDERCSFFPDVPSFKELGYEVVSGLHRGLLAPPDTPPEIISYLEEKLKAVYDDPAFQEKLENELGFLPVWTGSEGFAASAKQALVTNKELMKSIKD